MNKRINNLLGRAAGLAAGLLALGMAAPGLLAAGGRQEPELRAAEVI